nr:integrase, catalytic region, zinc finger, CCHC-type, peptidase aspartic, catalytic [Tanacetum cinerariifolium]
MDMEALAEVKVEIATEEAEQERIRKTLAENEANDLYWENYEKEFMNGELNRPKDSVNEAPQNYTAEKSQAQDPDPAPTLPIQESQIQTRSKRKKQVAATCMWIYVKNRGRSKGLLRCRDRTSSLMQMKLWLLRRHHKTPYELVHNKKPDHTFFIVFGALCYPTNDSEDLGKLQPTADTGIFVGYAPSRKGTGPALTFLTPGQISSGLVPNPIPATPYAPPPIKNWRFYFNQCTPLSTTIDQYAHSPHISPSSSALQSHSLPSGVIAEPHFMEDHNVAPVDNNPFVNVFALEPHSKASSSGDISSTESPYVSQTLHHLNKWSKDHPLDNVIGNPSRPVSTQKQLATDALWCLYSSVLSEIESKNFKSTIIEDCWFQAMQDEIHEFDRIQV